MSYRKDITKFENTVVYKVNNATQKLTNRRIRRGGNQMR